VAAPTVVILAAGQGTRMRSSTPKMLHCVCGLPMVLWPVRAALQAGARRIVVVDSPAQALREVLPEGVELAVQAEPSGTAGAVLAAISHLHATPAANGRVAEGEAGGGRRAVVVLSGDVPLVGPETIAALIEAHGNGAAAATLLTSLLEDPRGYGRIVRGPSGEFERVVETKLDGDSSSEERNIKEVNAGLYVFDADALEDVLPRLRAENEQGELYLPDALGVLREQGAAVRTHRLDDPAITYGVNDREQLARVSKLAQQQIHRRHMLAGVEIVDPDATVIDVDVEIGRDTVIEPFSTIKGRTRIGAGCLVRHSYLLDCVLEDGASVGPFAYLRPGAVLHAGAKVGTFVEVKNSDVGAAAKIPHLSYIGDADVGEQTNLGAGTITANYDGREKHRTTIGKRVRGGVDTAFVAPVTVGDEAYTAAGSVVTEDVPPGALAIARAKQENVEGFAERRERPLHSEEK
jgi:bifunctional UDP-N-acetylglucosamine pyrophosphorylase/glucosamine-1-phosphate N-acetyltransferase